MSQASSLLTQLEYRLAEQLFHTHWLPRSPLTQRLTLRLFRHCADAGHPGAMSLYGHMLYHRGVTPQEKARGARYVLEAAHGGDPRAQYQAGEIYEHGYALYPQRDDHAVTWYARAGEAGHPLAATRLARAYEKGQLGLGMDAERAEHWQRLADRQAGLLDQLDSGDTETRH
ncbi:tetratricopeptide repeat protein [Halomonas sp.]|uniref:tetratricopeptide repeat protein n=1 Tax=Halomonas sp. TaxID=1486246 RepID=UPI00356B1EE4